MKNFFKGQKLSGKGTAAVICFCLAAVAALGIFSYNRSAQQLRSELSGIASETVTTVSETEPTAENANAPAQVPFTEAMENSGEMILEQDAFGGKKQTKSETENPETTVSETEKSVQDAKGAVVKPVDGEIINAYSCGELVKSKTLSVWKTHDGIDVSAQKGTVVKSVTAGVVKDVCRDPLMGVTVVIDHGSGYEGWYCNLSQETLVSEGDNVDAGTVIGEVGDTAEAETSEPSHLHFGLKQNNAWVDPAEYLSGEGS